MSDRRSILELFGLLLLVVAVRALLYVGGII
jgi:hypothetical protein